MKSSTLVTFAGVALVVYSLAAPWLSGQGTMPPHDPGRT